MPPCHLLVRLTGMPRSGPIWSLGPRLPLNEEDAPVAEAAFGVSENVSEQDVDRFASGSVQHRPQCVARTRSGLAIRWRAWLARSFLFTSARQIEPASRLAFVRYRRFFFSKLQESATFTTHATLTPPALRILFKAPIVPRL